MECAPLASVDGNALRGISDNAARPERARVQTDCKRPACYSPPGAVTRRHIPRSKHARHGTLSPVLAAFVTVLGKLITQRSTVQICPPQRDEAARQRPAASFTRARSEPDSAQTAKRIANQARQASEPVADVLGPLQR